MPPFWRKKQEPQRVLEEPTPTPKPASAPVQSSQKPQPQAHPSVVTTVQAKSAATPQPTVKSAPPNSEGHKETRAQSRPAAALTTQAKPAAAPTPQQFAKKKTRRRPKNTVVVSLQMPEALVKVLDDIVSAGAYRSRSDVIMQTVRAHPEVSRRLARLEAKGPETANKKQ